MPEDSQFERKEEKEKEEGKKKLNTQNWHLSLPFHYFSILLYILFYDIQA